MRGLVLMGVVLGACNDGTGGGSYGPCSLAAAGHESATVITPRAVGSSTSDRFVGCNSGTFLFQNDSDYQAFESSRHPADGGVDGSSAALAVDWSRDTALVVVALSSAAFTFGTEAEAAVIAQGGYCQGVAPSCNENAYAIPKVSRIAEASCPRPRDPCLAP